MYLGTTVLLLPKINGSKLLGDAKECIIKSDDIYAVDGHHYFGVLRVLDEHPPERCLSRNACKVRIIVENCAVLQRPLDLLWDDIEVEIIDLLCCPALSVNGCPPQ